MHGSSPEFEKIPTLALFEREYLRETDVAAHVATHARFLARADVALVGTFSQGRIQWVAASAPDVAFPPADVPLILRAVHAMHAECISDLRDDAEASADLLAAGWRSAAVVGFSAEGAPTGVVLMLSREPRRWTAEEQAGIAHWIPLRQSMNRARAGTIARAQQARGDAEERFQTLFEAAPVGVVFLDDESRFTNANEAFARMCGRPLSEIIGLRVRDIATVPVHDETGPWLAEWLAGERPGYVAERTVNRPDGTQATLVITTVTAQLPGSEKSFKFSIVEDVTEARAREEAIRARDAQLIQAQRREIVGQLAAGMAHDFNNTLAIVAGFATLIQRTLDPASPVSGDADQILKVVQRASGMTRRLLMFSSKQHGVTERLNVSELVAEFAAAIRPMVPKSIRIVIQASARDLWAKADRTAVDQVLLNLALNARDAMSDGGTLTLSLAMDRAGPLAMARINVSDTGPGIDAAVLPLLWEPFFTTKSNGSGLGLPTSRAVMRNLGGDLQVSSPPGSGATFSLLIPLDEQPVVPAEPAGTTDLQGSGEWILLVEDDPVLQESTMRNLVLSGYRVMTASNGTDAFRLFLEHLNDIALIVTDLDMPEMSGRELVARIRDLGSEIRILVTSGGETVGPGRSDGRVMENAFLQRPFGMAELLSAIRRMIATTEASPHRLSINVEERS